MAVLCGESDGHKPCGNCTGHLSVRFVRMAKGRSVAGLLVRGPRRAQAVRKLHGASKRPLRTHDERPFRRNSLRSNISERPLCVLPDAKMCPLAGVACSSSNVSARLAHVLAPKKERARRNGLFAAYSGRTLSCPREVMFPHGLRPSVPDNEGIRRNGLSAAYSGRTLSCPREVMFPHGLRPSAPDNEGIRRYGLFAAYSGRSLSCPEQQCLRTACACSRPR